MKFRYRLVEVEAVQWNGPADNDSLRAFADHWVSIGQAGVYITTPSSAKQLNPGDWVVKAVGGNAYYSWGSEAFAARFEPAGATKTVFAAVHCNYGDQGVDFLGVFDTREAASAFVSKREPRESERQWYDIIETTVNAES